MNIQNEGYDQEYLRKRRVERYHRWYRDNVLKDKSKQNPLLSVIVEPENPALLEQHILREITLGRWPEEMLSVEFRHLYQSILTKQEWQIIEHKIEGRSGKEIALLFGIKVGSVHDIVYELKYKLHNKIGSPDKMHRLKNGDFRRSTKRRYQKRGFTKPGS